MKTLSAYTKIMDISLNLARIGDWTADSYEQKKTLINHFLLQTERYIKDLEQTKLPVDVQCAFDAFEKEFITLKNQRVTKESKDKWAETALTWANILQHRAKLA